MWALVQFLQTLMTHVHELAQLVKNVRGVRRFLAYSPEQLNTTGLWMEKMRDSLPFFIQVCSEKWEDLNWIGRSTWINVLDSLAKLKFQIPVESVRKTRLGLQIVLVNFQNPFQLKTFRRYTIKQKIFICHAPFKNVLQPRCKALYEAPCQPTRGVGPV